MLKRSYRSYIAPLALSLAIGFMLAACGSTSGNAGGIYGSTTSPTNTPASSASGATLKITSISLNGTSKMVLTNSSGMTLYYRSDDSASSPKCTGGCASAWPPFLANGTAPTAPSGASGPVTLVNGGNGSQVEYNGWPLYTFSGDTAPGGHAGENLMNIWHVAAPADMTTAPAGGSSSQPTATPGSGYGYK